MIQVRFCNPRTPFMKLEKKDLLAVVRTTPLVSIDLVIRDRHGRMLAGLRRNEPAKGTWFVPGGRICKGETVSRALARISREEIGVELSDDDVRFLGVYDHIYDTNFAEVEGISTQYVVLAYELAGQFRIEDLPGDQHAQWAWVSHDSGHDVHPNSMAYLA